MENNYYLNGSPIKDSDIKFFSKLGIPLLDSNGNCLYFSFHDVVDKNEKALRLAMSGDENNAKS
ncbi:MAG TPA: hypothetical protein DIW44_12450 [Anaerolineaceae bacterium]|nr:hypothetical protein [Anaerolineaceae bacterium]